MSGLVAVITNQCLPLFLVLGAIEGSAISSVEHFAHGVVLEQKGIGAGVGVTNGAVIGTGTGGSGALSITIGAPGAVSDSSSRPYFSSPSVPTGLPAGLTGDTGSHLDPLMRPPSILGRSSILPGPLPAGASVDHPDPYQVSEYTRQ